MGALQQEILHAIGEALTAILAALAACVVAKIKLRQSSIAQVQNTMAATLEENTRVCNLVLEHLNAHRCAVEHLAAQSPISTEPEPVCDGRR
jgi:hypothetical protein